MSFIRIALGVLLSCSVVASGVCQTAIYKDIPDDPMPLVVNQPITFPCWYCLAVVSRGGGAPGATSSIFDLHVISSSADVAFPRALVARIESSCTLCQPAALTAQAKGTNPQSTVYGANFEAYSQGRATVAEYNISAAAGGFVIDVVPTRLPDGSPSKVDSVLKVEGFKGDAAAATVQTYIDAKIRPSVALVRFSPEYGPVTIVARADGRALEEWSQDSGGVPHKHFIVDGRVISVDDDPIMADNRRLSAHVAQLEEQVAKLVLALQRQGIATP